MSNTLITPTQLTRESLRVLHQKLNFIGTIDRQYDKQFAKDGYKIGSSLRIRKPNQFQVRTGVTLDAQDVPEEYTTLNVTTRKGVDMKFSSSELTLDIDRFSERYIEPAMSVLAATIEADAMSMYKDVYNEVSDVGASASSLLALGVSKKLTDNLAKTSGRTLNLNTQDNLDLVEALKGLFNDPAKISSNFREGMVANNFLGFSNVMQNTLWPIHTTGTDDGTGDYLTDIAAGEADGSAGSLHVDTGAGTFKKGDIVFITGVYRVHPETKVSTGKLQQFVVTSDYSGGEGDLAISPSIIATGAKQNVNALPANDVAVLKLESDETTAIGNAADYGISLGYEKDAFTFATVDLEMPNGVDFKAREVYDGISMRIIRQYDINNDQIPCRIDVHYGYLAQRPELACRLGLH